MATDDELAPDSMPESEQESELDELLAEYIDRLNAGEILDSNRVRFDHPELAEELLERLAAFREFGASEPLAPVSRTFGDYTLRRQIGSGGMGVVYEAWQGSMDRVVALKILPPGVAADDRVFQRFVQEARTAGRLNHQSVVPVYSSGIEEGTPWFSMELVEGETLANVLERTRHLSPESETPFGPKDEVDYFVRLGRAFAEVADGLQHAHSRGVTHRDIKPSNLILDETGRVRILDFGLARLEGQQSLTLPGIVVGTPLYMSPEQVRRHRVGIDHRTDIWSLGATMYEAVSGRPPFQGKDQADTLSRITDREPAEPRRLDPRLPRDLETIILKCLRKDLHDRYGTAEALAQDLRRFVRGDAIEARSQTLVDRWTRRIARHRSMILATACLLVAGFAATVAHSILVGEERDRALRERDRADRTVYVAHMRLAQRDWDDGNVGSLFETLDLHVPSGTRSGEIDRRGWEWYFLHHLPRRGLVAEFPGRVIQWSPDGSRMAVTNNSGDGSPRVTVHESATWKKVLEFDDVGPLMAAIFNADGTRLATFGWWDPAGIRIRDATTGTLHVTLEPEFADDTIPHVRYFAWHPDGRRLALTSQLGEVQIWDAVRGRLLGTPLRAAREPEAVWHVSAYVEWSPDGRLLTRIRRGEVVVLEEREPDDWRPVAEPSRTAGYRGFGRWSPDSSVLGVSGEDEIVFWNARGTETLGRVSGLHGVDRFDWSPDGERIACGLSGGAVAVLDVSSRRVTRTIRGHSDFAWNADWCPRPGSQLLSTAGRDGTVRTWDMSRRGGEEVDATAPQAFAWSKNGRFLALVDGPEVELSSAASDTERQVQIPNHEWTIAIRDDETGDHVSTLELDGWSPPSKIEFGPDDALLAACGWFPSERARVGAWSWRDATLLWERREPTRAVAWRPQGDLLATSDGVDVVLRRVRDGEEASRLTGHDGNVCNLAWRPDGQVLASGSDRFEVILWSHEPDDSWCRTRTLDLDELAPYPVFGGSACPIAWSADGTRLFAGGGPGMIWIFDARTGAPLTRIRAHSTRILSLDPSPDGCRLASSAEGGKVRVWGLDEEARLDRLLVLPVREGDLLEVAWHPAGRRLTALAWPKAIHVWEAPEYEPVSP